VIKDSHIQTTGHIFIKSVLLITYVGDVVLVAGTRRDQMEGFHSLEGAARRTGHRINNNKTQYMCMNITGLSELSVLETGTCTFEPVDTFTHLGTKINKVGNIRIT
jgi:hypothetical protein